MNHRILLFTLCMGMAASANATDLGDINVTANRTTSEASTSSKSVTVIDRQTIESSHAENVVELLKGRANITVRDTSGVGAKSQVDLGGYGESASANQLVLIDGRRVNSPDLSGTDWAQIPLDQIERIEIVHGSGSVLYGQGAVGGVINIITRIPQSGSSISAEIGSFGAVAGGLRAGATADNVRLEASVSGRKSEGYRKNGKFERYDSGMRGEIDLSAENMLYFSGNHHTDRAGLPGGLSLAQMAADRRQTNSPADFSQTTDDFINAGLQLGVGAANADLPVSYRKRNTLASYGGFQVPGVLRSLSVRPKLELEQKLGPVNARGTVGVDAQRTDGNFGGIRAKRSTSGYYGFVTLMDKGGRFGLSGGYRSEGLKDELTQTANSGTSSRKGVYEIGLIANAGDFNLGLNHSTSVRMPLLDERFDWWTLLWNPALQVQTGKHSGVTARYRHGTVSAEVAFTRADLTHEIFYNPATFSNENYTDKTRHDVFLVQGQWEVFKWAKLSGNYTYTKATFRGGAYDGNTIPAVPQQKAGVRFDAEFENGVGAGINLRWVGNSWLISDQANAGPKLASYVVADAVVRYRWHEADMFLRVDNLSNSKYSNYGHVAGSYYPAPELGVRGGASYSF